jgi:hypothetical protein
MLVAALTLVVTGCEQPAQSSENASAPALPPRSGQLAVRPVVPTAPGESIPALADTELQEAAAVSQLHLLPEQNAKVFSISGGDPAVNGLVTYLGLYISSAEGWRVYAIGDFAEWRLTEASKGRLVLTVRQDTAGPDGDIQARDFRVIVAFDRNLQTPPPTITVTEGR